jgi:hypothetical protein
MLKVCLGTYKAYNEGNYGKWIDISDFADEEELMDWLKETFNESDPEYMVQDADYFADVLGETPDLEDLFVLNEILEDNPNVNEGVIEDAVEIYGLVGAKDGLDNFIGDRQTVADEYVYENYCQKVNEIQDEELRWFFQNIVDKIDCYDEVDSWVANGDIVCGRNGNYFWK